MFNLDDVLKLICLFLKLYVHSINEVQLKLKDQCRSVDTLFILLINLGAQQSLGDQVELSHFKVKTCGSGDCYVHKVISVNFHVLFHLSCFRRKVRYTFDTSFLPAVRRKYKRPEASCPCFSDASPRINILTQPLQTEHDLGHLI